MRLCRDSRCWPIQDARCCQPNPLIPVISSVSVSPLMPSLVRLAWLIPNVSQRAAWLRLSPGEAWPVRTRLVGLGSHALRCPAGRQIYQAQCTHGRHPLPYPQVQMLASSPDVYSSGPAPDALGSAQAFVQPAALKATRKVLNLLWPPEKTDGFRRSAATFVLKVRMPSRGHCSCIGVHATTRTIFLLPLGNMRCCLTCVAGPQSLRRSAQHHRGELWTAVFAACRHPGG
jgi:hypothetical protein